MQAMFQGLTSREAAARLAAEGPNELPHAGHRSLPRILRDVLSEPMFGLLLGAGLIYLFLGDTVEALLLLVFASLSVVIAVVQETRSERVLEALRDLTSPRALVIRDGERKRIAGREVVRGDLIVLSEGDRVPADATLIQARELEIDESLLTGESVPVRKRAAKGTTEAKAQPGGDDLPYVFSGTLVVRGQGLAIVHATGASSEIGRIGQTLGEIETAPPRLSRQTARLVRIAAGIGLLCCVLVFVLYGLLRGSWLAALLAGITLGMSMLPEEFPLVLTVFMVMGAWRLSQARVLTRRAAAIEMLGEATVLCTDKTGTLTENRMSVVALHAAGSTLAVTEQTPLAPPFSRLAITAALASASEAYDPMDRACQELARRAGIDTAGFSLERLYGLTPELMAVTQVWRTPAEDEPLRVAAKGAPEAIAELCRLDAEKRAALVEEADRMAAAGMRVLAVAEASASAPLPETPRSFAFNLLGLVGLADPLRPSVPAAIRECQAAGIRVVMITGDYPITAKAIARQAGLDADTVLDGPTIAQMSDAELEAAVRHVGIFARIVPAQKLRIVQALKAKGDVVAMTGDGVNDAPSLKAADIGIAMGGRGTDVAREAASLVLLDDDFGSIVRTIRLGRRIYDNLRKAMAYIIAVHVPIAGLALLPLLAGMPLIFGPVHIAFLEMVIDPVCSMVFEAEPAEADVMARPPRAATSPLFSPALVVWSLLQGAAALIPLGLLYSLALRRGLPEGDARALTFVSLVLLDLGLVVVNRSFTTSLADVFGKGNRALWWVSAVTLALLALVLLWPVGRELFRFGPLHSDDLALVAIIVLSVLAALEWLKGFWRAKLIA
ncbi:MAG: cation-translocating P-type ATPase [Acidobacteriia bacterium]|nr:cation-translocating P-type ATPase [Methyloceanibacter sp.]MCL6492832.1 cation-translocating P-type ATPase [Terriglobia bacterium]